MRFRTNPADLIGVGCRGLLVQAVDDGMGGFVDIKNLSFVVFNGVYRIVQNVLQGICAKIPRIIQEFLALSHELLLTFPHHFPACAS